MIDGRDIRRTFSTRPLINWQKAHDNMYPYGYDVGFSNEKRSAGNIIRKYATALKGKDPRRAAFDEVLDLDLDSEEGIRRFNELKSNFTNLPTNDPKLLQQMFRHRYDEMRLYDGYPQKYNSWIRNPQYKSATAGSSPTYIHSNPEYRKRM